MGLKDKWNVVKGAAHRVGEALFSNTSINDGASGLVNFSYNTVARLLEQVPTVPRLTRIVLNPKVKKIIKGVGRIAVEDVIPLALVSYAHHLMQQQINDYLDDDPNDMWLPTQLALQWSLYLLMLSNFAYSTRKKTQIVVRTSVLVLEAGSTLNSIKVNPPMLLCEQEKCTTLRFLKGSFRDVIDYWATKAAISLVGYIPQVGGGLALALNVYHDGRYVVTLAVPDLCSRHQEQYLQEYPELALSHGMTHHLLSWYINSMLSNYTSVPSVFYATTIQQFLLIGQIALATQMTLPPPVGQSHRSLPDPLAAYSNIIGFTVDTIILGLKAQIPKLLKKRQTPKLSLDDISRYTEMVWSNRLSENVLKPILLPRMLQNRQAFINDPVIPWPALQNRILNALDNIQAIRQHMLTKVALLTPTFTAEVVRPIFGTPKSVVELILNVMKNEPIMRQLESFRHMLPALESGDAPPIPQSEGFILRGQQRETPQILPPPEIKGRCLEPHQAMSLSQSPSYSSAEEKSSTKESQGDSVKTGVTIKRVLSPGLVITGKKDATPVSCKGFFSDVGKLDPRKVMGSQIGIQMKAS